MPRVDPQQTRGAAVVAIATKLVAIATTAPGRRLAGLMLGMLLAGCATSRQATFEAVPADLEQRMRQTLVAAVPRPGRVMQRGIINAAGRQFSGDGLVQLAADGSWRMALLTPMGVIAELRRDSQGTVTVVKTAPGFRPDWAREQVARTVELLFPAGIDQLRGVRLADGRPALLGSESRLYIFDATGSHWMEARSGSLRARRPGQAWQVNGPRFEAELRTVNR